MNPCHTWKLCGSPLKIFVELVDFQNKLPHPFRKRILAKQEVNNKIHTAYVDPCFDAFPNCDLSKNLNQGRTTCQETPSKISARSNGQIENYDCCRKTGLLHILRQNLNLTFPGSYQEDEDCHQVKMQPPTQQLVIKSIVLNFGL